jgi:mono/diheme cytochrome c family protein
MRVIVIFIVFSIVLVTGCGTNGDKKPPLKTEIGPPPSEETAGEKLYAVNCASCHMEDGAGVPNLNAPLINSAYVRGDKDKLIHIVLEGSAAFANDPPRTYRNPMAALPYLSDQEIADVLTYVRNNFSNTGTPVTAGEVSKVRARLRQAQP